MMSPNCWSAIEHALRSRSPFRYLEWGGGNSTIAALRIALESSDTASSTLLTIESNPEFANVLIHSLVETLRASSIDGEVRVERLRFPIPGIIEALRRDPAVERHEAQFLKALWKSRNDSWWAPNAHPATEDLGFRGGVRRQLSLFQCALAYRWHRLRRALHRPEHTVASPTLGTITSPNTPTLTGQARVVIDTDRTRLVLLVIPQLRNRLWKHWPILDGLYQEFSDYVSVPLDGPFDVILVDGRARTSCLKRVHYDRLLAPGGVVFLHDAHRPSHLEAIRLFDEPSYVRGSIRTGPSQSAPPELLPPMVRSGRAFDDAEVVYDRELFFFEAPGGKATSG